ncbi:hypothetical protein FOL46_003447 [Perkinsus olseni]|uniref:Uncharacterized protein n=1 Tax=Perkinsus olseni TaxID=32597 RepID=A0A7J6M2M7_PEROL|nr:hypothetical protein FOL46_003447 [Perkinsus olseni]
MYTNGRRISTSSDRGFREAVGRSKRYSTPSSQARGRVSVTTPQNYPQRPPLHPSTPRLARSSPRSSARSISLTLDTPGPSESGNRSNVVSMSTGWEGGYGGEGLDVGREASSVRQQKRSRRGSAEDSPRLTPRGYRFKSLEDARSLEQDDSRSAGHGEQIEDPLERTMRLQRKYLRSKIPISGPNPLPALCRVIGTAVFLFLMIFASASSYTRSTQWLGNTLCMRTVDGDAIVSNPVFAAWTAASPRNAIDGKRCRLWMQLDPNKPVQSAVFTDFGDYAARTGLQCGFFDENVFGGNCAGGRCLTCIADRPCFSTVSFQQIEAQEVVWTDNRFPVFPSTGSPADVSLFLDDQMTIQLSDTAVGLMPICSLDAMVTPGHSIVIIALYIGSIILLMLLVMREVIEWFKVRRKAHEDTVDDAVMVAHIGEAVEAMKRETESSSRHNSDLHDDAAGRHRDVGAQRSRAGSDRRSSSSSQGPATSLPGTLSTEWRIKLENMKVGAGEMQGLLDALLGIGSASYWPFTDLLALGDIFILMILLLPPTCRPQWFLTGPLKGANKTRRGEIRHNMMANSEACVIILVRSGTCANPSRRQRLANLVQRCEDLFPAARAGQSKVFVVDFGGGRTPKDDCCNMLRRVVSFNINYAYLPEDNPVVALHWANKVWIPAVAKRHSLENKDEPKRALYRYALVVNDFDGVDERDLPRVFNSHCREHIEKGTQLVILPPRAMMPSGSVKTSWMVDDFLIQRENIRYVSFQGLTGSVVTTPPNSLCLWDRISLYGATATSSGAGKVCWSSELDQAITLRQLTQVECRTELASQPVSVSTKRDFFASYCSDWALQGKLLWELINFKCVTFNIFFAKFWILFDQYIPKFFAIARPLMLVVIFFRSPFDIVFILLVYLLLLLPLTVSAVALSLRRSRELVKQWSMTRLLAVLPVANAIREIFYGFASLYYVIFAYRPLYPSLDYMSKKHCGSGLPPLPGDGGRRVNWFTVWCDRGEEEIEYANGSENETPDRRVKTDSEFGGSESAASRGGEFRSEW